MTKTNLFICTSLILVPIFTFSFRLGGTLVLLISLMIWLFWARNQDYEVNTYQRWFLICSSTLFLVSFLLFALAGFPDDGGKDIAKYARLILAYPLMVLIILAKPKQHFFWIGITIASILSGILAIADFIFIEQTRADVFGMFSPIFFANHSLLFSYLSFLSFYWFRKNQCEKLSWFSLVGIASAIVGMLMAGSRGVLVALPIIALFVVTYLCLEKKFRVIGVFASVIAICITIVWQSQSLIIKNRVELIPIQVDSYLYQGDASTPVGIRLYMWETAWFAFLEKPLFGHGPGNYKGLTYKSMLRDEYQTNMNNHSHAHNEYLHAMATKGIVGLITLFGILLVPLMAAISLFRQHQIIYGFALAGITLGFAFFGLTDMVFMKGSGATLYTFLVAVLMSLGFTAATIQPYKSSPT